MFDNIGDKIKALAVVTTVIGIVTSVISGLVLLFSDMVLVGFLTMILGSLSAWVGSFVLYGFGELIEQQTNAAAFSAKIVNLLSRDLPKNGVNSSSNATPASEEKGYSLSQMAQQRSVQSMKGSDFWVCKSCKTKNDAFALYCKNCGQFK